MRSGGEAFRRSRASPRHSVNLAKARSNDEPSTGVGGKVHLPHPRRRSRRLERFPDAWRVFLMNDSAAFEDRNSGSGFPAWAVPRPGDRRARQGSSDRHSARSKEPLVSPHGDPIRRMSVYRFQSRRRSKPELALGVASDRDCFRKCLLLIEIKSYDPRWVPVMNWPGLCSVDVRRPDVSALRPSSRVRRPHLRSDECSNASSQDPGLRGRRFAGSYERT